MIPYLFLDFFLLKTLSAVFRENGLEKKMTFLRGKMEEVTLPFEKVGFILDDSMTLI